MKTALIIGGVAVVGGLLYWFGIRPALAGINKVGRAADQANGVLGGLNGIIGSVAGPIQAAAAGIGGGGFLGGLSGDFGGSADTNVGSDFDIGSDGI